MFAEGGMFGKIRDWLWPLAATVLALFVAPIAIEQYPEIFKESPWILPLSITIVCGCWLIPLLVHDRTRRFHRWTIDRLGRKVGWAMILAMGGLLAAVLVFGGVRLYGKHKRHLEARLNRQQVPLPAPNSQESPQSPLAGATHPSQPLEQHEKQPTPSTIIPRKRSAEGKLNQPAPTQAEPTAPTEKQQPPVFIETAPTFGNLGDRAIALSDEIMQDLYWHGWKNWGNRPGQQTPPVQQMPTKPEEIQAWTRSRSSYFRFRFFERILDIRNEFAQLHLRDERLDDFFKYQGMIEQANRQMAAASPGREIDAPMLPQQIEEVAERLKVLANQIPIQRAAPKALHFSVTRVQPEKPEFSFEMVATIDTDTDISAGYIAVEFDGARAFTATDFTDSKLVFLNDENIIGNKPLKGYLSVHASDSYILAVGKTPLTSKKPIHVVAAGAVPFNVTKVTLFDK